MYGDDIHFMMKQRYDDMLVELFERYSDIIVAVLSGHQQYDTFQIYGHKCKPEIFNLKPPYYIIISQLGNP